MIDAHKLQVIERLSTTLTTLAPEGSTPDALAIDNTRKLLYVANADNNSITVAHIENRAHSTVLGLSQRAGIHLRCFSSIRIAHSILVTPRVRKAKYLFRTKGQTGLQRWTAQLEPSQALNVWKVATPEERQQLRPVMAQMYQKGEPQNRVAFVQTIRGTAGNPAPKQ